MRANNFRFTDLLDRVQLGTISVREILDELERIGNSYARSIAYEIATENNNKAIDLLKKSSEFESRMNSPKNVGFSGIVLTEEEIQARINRDVWCKGMTREYSTKLNYRRAGRLSRNIAEVHSSIEHGSFIVG